MKRATNVMVLTYWNFKDALIQTYTLPYVRFILEELPAGGRVFLVTFERSQVQPVKIHDRIVHIVIPY
ncbi:MAG: hypothetical protein M3R08_05840, partial [Bacteroidota bacterium]|nr:hypothetical protein [Bacteroidota bacterium]